MARSGLGVAALGIPPLTPTRIRGYSPLHQLDEGTDVIRTITREQLETALYGVSADILRSYNIKMNVVTTVDNRGEACTHCGNAYARVAVNIYATDMQGEDHSADCCVDCITNVIDGEVDTDPRFTVLIEIAQGAR